MHSSSAPLVNGTHLHLRNLKTDFFLCWTLSFPRKWIIWKNWRMSSEERLPWGRCRPRKSGNIWEIHSINTSSLRGSSKTGEGLKTIWSQITAHKVGDFYRFLPRKSRKWSQRCRSLIQHTLLGLFVIMKTNIVYHSLVPGPLPWLLIGGSSQGKGPGDRIARLTGIGRSRRSERV